MSDGERRAATTLADCDIKTKPIWHDELKHVRVIENPDELTKFDLDMEEALLDDKKDRFLRLIKSATFEIESGRIARDIIDEDAVNCAAAVLAGETNGLISPDFELLSDDGWTLLHQCAASFSVKIIRLLLHIGFSADAKADWVFKSFILKQQLPLNVALTTLSYRCKHSIGFLDCRKRSAARLIIELSQEIRGLETIRLLALNTRKFRHEFFKYVKEGKMVEVAALLLAGGEKFLPLCTSEGEEVLVFNSFKEIGHFVLAKNTWSAMSNDDLTEMKETLLLLDIYDKIGNQLSAYVRLKERRPIRAAVLDLATLIKDAGFDVKIEDVYFEDWAYRLWSSLFERRILQICAKKEDDEKRFKRLVLPGWLNQYQSSLPFCSKSRQPSIPTLPARNLYHTSLFGNADSKYASLTPEKRKVNSLRSLNPSERWGSFMKILRRGVRRM